jgi:hypothetical protein
MLINTHDFLEPRGLHCDSRSKSLISVSFWKVDMRDLVHLPESPSPEPCAWKLSPGEGLRHLFVARKRRTLIEPYPL